jgi:hypothetical protein
MVETPQSSNFSKEEEKKEKTQSPPFPQGEKKNEKHSFYYPEDEKTNKKNRPSPLINQGKSPDPKTESYPSAFSGFRRGGKPP